MTNEHKTDLTSYYLKCNKVIFDMFRDDTPSIEDEEYWHLVEALIGEELIND